MRRTIQCAWNDPYTYGNAQITVRPQSVEVVLRGSQLGFLHNLIKLEASPWLEVGGVRFTIENTTRCLPSEAGKSELLVDCTSQRDPLPVTVVGANGSPYGTIDLDVSFETLLAKVSSLDKWKNGDRVVVHVVLRDKNLAKVADEQLIFEPAQCTVSP